jgi:exodeoxyribonuclease VII small subunit
MDDRQEPLQASAAAALEEMSFEEAMDKLEAIVARLESGDVPLEAAIELFQEGMALSRLCGQKLDQVERRIEMLLEDENGGLIRKPFVPAKDEAAGSKGE